MQTVAAVARSGVAAVAFDERRVDLASLIERVRITGLHLDAELDDAGLDPTQRVVVFSVVQEALTNVLRHAPGSRATVAVRTVRDRLEIIVSNTAATASGSGVGSGRGLAGIRERVVACAGEVAWGPVDDGGFAVRAVLPAAPVPTAVPVAAP
jgi:signal transduction histidine kinase